MVSILLMILPIMIYKSLDLAIRKKYKLSILIISIYMFIFYIVLYELDHIFKDKNIHDFYNIKLEDKLNMVN